MTVTLTPLFKIEASKVLDWGLFVGSLCVYKQNFTVLFCFITVTLTRLFKIEANKVLDGALL